MLQRGLDYVAATVIICAVGAALLVLAAEILSFSSPVADTAAALGAAVLLNSLRRRIPARARHRSGPKTRIGSGGTPARISAGVLRQASRHQGCRPGQQQRGSCPGPRSHPGTIAAAPRDRSWTCPDALTDRMSRQHRVGSRSTVALRRSAAPVTDAILWLLLWPRTCGDHPGRRPRWNQPAAGRTRPGPFRAGRRTRS
jgi:hypothetical protein